MLQKISVMEDNKIMTAARKAVTLEVEEKNIFTKRLLISVDPGFDAHKIIINGKAFGPYPSIALIKSGLSLDFARRPDAAEITFPDGVTYTVGRYARESLTAEQSDENTLILNRQYDLYTRFSSNEFKAAFLTSIFCALTEYASSKNPAGLTLDDLGTLIPDGWDVRLIVEVPHAVRETAGEAIGNILVSAASNDFTVTCGTNKPVEVKKFNLNLDNLKVYSQALSAFRSLMYKPDGTEYTVEDVEARELLDSLEALVIDSGYRTTAVVRLSVNLEEETSPLNESAFSMKDVDDAAAKDMTKAYGSRPVRPASITNALEKGEKVTLQMPGGGTKLVDAAPFRTAALERKMVIFNDRIIHENASIANVKSVFVCGGTGSLMYDSLRECFTSNYPGINSVRLISGYEIEEKKRGKDLGPVYTVCYGGYMTLLNKLVREDMEE